MKSTLMRASFATDMVCANGADINDSAEQVAGGAIALNGAMLLIFSRLLAGLIGAPLSRRLLLSILKNSSEASSLPS